MAAMRRHEVDKPLSERGEMDDINPDNMHSITLSPSRIEPPTMAGAWRLPERYQLSRLEIPAVPLRSLL